MPAKNAFVFRDDSKQWFRVSSHEEHVMVLLQVFRKPVVDSIVVEDSAATSNPVATANANTGKTSAEVATISSNAVTNASPKKVPSTTTNSAATTNPANDNTGNTSAEVATTSSNAVNNASAKVPSTTNAAANASASADVATTTTTTNGMRPATSLAIACARRSVHDDVGKAEFIFGGINTIFGCYVL